MNIPRPASWLLWVVLVGIAAFLAGCPTYEDTYSGTFREVLDSSNRSSDALEVDFFRFGDNAAAIVRLYSRDPITGDPFGEEQFCAWTSAEPFEEDSNEFRLYINKSSTQLPRSQLFGTVIDDTVFDITLVDERTGEPYDGIEDLEIERIDEEPDSDCRIIEDFAVSVEFPRDSASGRLQAMPASAGHPIENPVLSISWLGVEPVQGNTSFAPINRHTPAVPLDDGFGSNFDPSSHALKSDRTVLIPPPPDIVRMPSGTTTMALAHFAVVDDSEDDRPQPDDGANWQFSWDTDSEKLVASALRRATRPECIGPINHWGSALLFVEDHLTDLSVDVQSDIIGLNQCLQEDGCDGHFFLVDVCAEDTTVDSITLRNSYDAGGRTIPSVSLFVTDEYLGTDSIPLPRINPYLP